MLGKRRNNATGMPVHPTDNPYDQRTAASLSVYNADLVPPATSYATSVSPVKSRLAVPTIGPKVGAPYTDHHWRRNGLFYNWAWGGTNQGDHIYSLPEVSSGLNGFVRSSAFQTTLVQLHDWQTNSKWYIAWNGTGSGMFNGSKDVRYTYPSFRVDQIDTMVTGLGPQTMRMRPSPRFTAVQRLKRPVAQVPRYNTKSRNS